MNVQIEESWKTHLEPEFEKDYFRTLTEFVRSEYSQYQIFPPGKLIFNAFNLCPFDKVKVVIIGQDPYHGLHKVNADCPVLRPSGWHSCPYKYHNPVQCDNLPRSGASI